MTPHIHKQLELDAALVHQVSKNLRCGQMEFLVFNFMIVSLSSSTSCLCLGYFGIPEVSPFMSISVWIIWFAFVDLVSPETSYRVLRRLRTSGGKLGGILRGGTARSSRIIGGWEIGSFHHHHTAHYRTAPIVARCVTRETSLENFSKIFDMSCIDSTSASCATSLPHSSECHVRISWRLLEAQGSIHHGRAFSIPKAMDFPVCSD